MILKIPSEVFWPYFAGTTALTIGLLFLPRQEIRRAHGLDKLLWFAPMLVAIAMAVFGADHFVTTKFVASIVPDWMPWHVFWAYFVGVALLASALSLTTTVYSRLAAMMLGIMLLLFVVLMHIPNFIQDPRQKIVHTLFLRDMNLGAGILSFAAWRNALGITPRGRLSRFNVLLPRVTSVTRFLFAFPIAIFGIEQFLNPALAPGYPQNPAVVITLPAWIPVHAFWSYATGLIFIACALGLTTKPYARIAAKTFGVTVLALILVAYIPRTIAQASSVQLGLNYLAIYCALSGAAFMLAGGLPQRTVEAARVADVKVANPPLATTGR